MKENNDALLNKVFVEKGKEYGYDTVSAEFVAFKEFKIQWQRSYRWASFRVSDYLQDANEEILSSLASTLFGKIHGEKNVPYSDEMKSWATNKKFSEKNRPTFIKRAKNLLQNKEGDHKNLKESFLRLKEMELVDDEDDIELIWMVDNRTRKAASCSVLMKLIMVSEIMDKKDIPDYVLDYIIYIQYLRIRTGAEYFGTTEEYNSDVDRIYFDKYKEAEAMMDMFDLNI